MYCVHTYNVADLLLYSVQQSILVHVGVVVRNDGDMNTLFSNNMLHVVFFPLCPQEPLSIRFGGFTPQTLSFMEVIRVNRSNGCSAHSDVLYFKP